ncbi:hypothetical protein B0T21DRAFT_428138, partial [Apiosordaria backusii]
AVGRGCFVVKGLRLDQNNILQERGFEAATVEEEYSGYTGNEGVSATHLYRVTALVLVRRDLVPDFLNRPCYEENEQLRMAYFARLSLQKDCPPSLVEALSRLCDKAWEKKKEMPPWKQFPTSIDGPVMSDILKAFILHGRLASFEEAACYQHDLPLDFFVWAQKWWEDQNSDERFKSIQSGISKAISQYGSFMLRFTGIVKFAPRTAQTKSEAVNDWALAMIDSALRALAAKSPGRDMAKTVVFILKYVENKPSFLSDQLVEILHPSQQSATFFISILKEIHEEGQKGSLPATMWTRLYRTIAESFISLTDFAKAENGLTPLTGYDNRPVYMRGKDDKHGLDVDEMIEFLSHLIELGPGKDENETDLATAFLFKLIANGPRVPAMEFEPIWLPFLNGLLDVLQKTPDTRRHALYQELFSVILRSYITNYVGRPPAATGSLVRPSVRQCPNQWQDCVALNRFLKDTTQSVWRFPAAEPRRKHLIKQMQAVLMDAKTEIEREKTPFTLVVIKTFVKEGDKKAAWERRKATAVSEIKRFDQNQLQKMLGDGFEAIVSADVEKILRGPRSSSAVVVPPTATGQKRKAERQSVDFS